MPEVTLRLNQPAALGRRPQETGAIDTHRHVPGTVLRGALAHVWIREHGEPRETTPEKRAEFVHLFEGPVRYGPLFDTASDVVPLSVLVCKYRQHNACHGFYHDEAAPDAMVNGSGPPHCTSCGGRTQPGRGEIEFFGGDAGLRQHTRVALDETGRAREQMLFTRKSLHHRVGGAAREFTGRIVGGDPGRLGWLMNEHRVRIGARRSTSGDARYVAIDSPEVLPDPTALVHDGTLVVRLASPALLVDAAGRPVQRPDERQLSELLGVQARVEQSWTRREQVTGWNALTDLPKPTELSVSAGSVFRLELGSAPDSEGLARLATHGLGLRRAEGFGWVALGTWTPPRTATATAPPEKENESARIARLLHETTGDAPWYLDRLRDCLLARRLGREPDLGFLASRRAESLDRYLGGALRTDVERLVGASTHELKAAVEHLEARVRKERAQ